MDGRGETDLQEMLSGMQVGGFVILRHPMHGIQRYFRGHQSPLKVLQRRDHVFAYWEDVSYRTERARKRNARSIWLSGECRLSSPFLIPQ